MVALRLFQPRSLRRIYVSGSPNTELVMRLYQRQSLSWNLVNTNRSSVGGRSSTALKKLDKSLEKGVQSNAGDVGVIWKQHG